MYHVSVPSIQVGKPERHAKSNSVLVIVPALCPGWRLLRSWGNLKVNHNDRGEWIPEPLVPGNLEMWGRIYRECGELDICRTTRSHSVHLKMVAFS